MKWLAIDTSAKHLTVTLFNGKSVTTSYIEDTKLSHSTSILTEIEKVLDSSNTLLKDIDVFCACLGPGSFTGIRIGVSTCKAFAYSLNKKVLPITSFETLAYNTKGKAVCVINANHDNFYAQTFNDCMAESQPSFITLNELKELSKTHTVVASEQIEGFEVLIVDVCSGLIKACQNKIQQATFDREVLIPLYVKKSQAEEGV